MKKQNTKRRRWLVARQTRQNARFSRLAGLRRHGHVVRTGPTTSILAVPVLHAEREDGRKKIQQVIDSAIAILQRPSTRVRFDFSRTHRVFPGGMLILLSHIALLLEIYPGRISARCAPRSMPAQLLSHFGFAKRLGVNEELNRANHDSVVKWRYLTGTEADGPAITTLLLEIKGSSTAVIPEGLYEVLTEALTNVCHHAYPDSYDLPREVQRWWLFSRLDNPTESEPGNLYVGVYDIGVGIQATMKEQLRKREALLDIADSWIGWGGWSSRLLERKLLHAAVEDQRSRTGFSFRGNGLPEMREFVLQTDSGSLSIISGRTQYTCKASTASSTCNSCDVETTGTLILWSIPLQFKEQEP